MMPKLSDTQAVLLAAAAARADLSVLPAPETLKLKGAALERTLKALLGRGLIAEAPMTGRGSDVDVGRPRRRSGERKRLVITPAGLDAIGVESQRAGDGATDAAAEQRQQPRAARRATGRQAGRACWMRSRARRARRSKT